MNFYGLYQAVRSRLHFSQVAAWWSRSNGAAPSYITTRVVPYNEENLRKFQEAPVEHTFPLAGSGDGNSIKVRVDEVADARNGGRGAGDGPADPSPSASPRLNLVLLN